MGVVRREGDWRLEKQDEGVYEITYEKQLQATVLTPDYNPNFTDSYTAGMVPVHEVNSYAEAEGLFEEQAHSDQTVGIGSSSIQSAPSDSFADFDNGIPTIGSDHDGLSDIEELPPGGFALVSLIAGALFIRTSSLQPNSTVFVIGAGCLVFGVGVLSWAIYSTDTLAEAVNYLTTVEEIDTSNTEGDDKSKKTPPTPQKLKDRLYFERAEQKCEWCENDTNQLEVHHIKPRREGGPNEPKNLIVLCPNCHREADAGAISRTKLRGKLKRLQET